MDERLRQRLLSLLSELCELRQVALADSGSYLNVTVGPEPREATLEGDAAGLIHFAAHVLDLATKEFEGAHAHFDEDSNCGAGSDSLIVAKWFG